MPHARTALLSMFVLFGVLQSVFAEPAQPPKSGRYWVYIGTYTSKEGSQGIYRSEFDVKSGELGKPKLVAEVVNPTFLTISPDHKFLYAIGETGDQGPKKNEGSIHSYSIDSATGDLTKLNSLTTGGGGPCHVSVNSTGKFAVVANYGGGSSAAYSLKADGSLDKQIFFSQHAPSGANGHCAMFNVVGNEEYAYIVDLGLDRVFSYKLDAEHGKLVPTEPPFVKLPEKCGPRHIAFNAKSGKAYVCGERDSTIITLKRGSHGTLEITPTTPAVLSTLPKDLSKEIRGKNSTAQILVHPDDGHVLVSNRGHNSLAVFEVNANKTEAGPHIMGTGAQAIQTPRNFNVDPTGRWILIGNQDGGSIFVAEWSNGNAKIGPQAIKVQNPVCIEFLAKP